MTEDALTYWEVGRNEPSVRYYPFAECEGLPGVIRRFRYENGLSQKQLGKSVGVDGTTICDWENKKTEPKGNFLARLKNVCR